MGFHNPFIKDGLIKFPDNGSLVKHVERWAKVRGDKLAYRFLDFSTERDGVARDLLWADFGARNRAVGARLQQVTQPGDRVAILCPQNLDYLVAFFGTLYSGRIAVPLFDPNEPGHVGRLHAVLDDCEPSAILTTTEAAEGVRKFFRTRPANQRPRVIAVDAVPDEVGATWVPVDVDHDTIAYLQYTSGSTRIPTGVQITHLNLATNVVQVIEALQGEEGDRGVSWLPFFHDMGLITVLLSPMIGHYVTFMTPAAFVRRPSRWIRELARKEGETGGTYSVAPNFAFDHAAARGVPKDGEPPLDLSNVKAILNGSEPISAATVRRFNEAFGPFGFKPQAIKPSYGLAEATLFVSTTPIDAEPRITYVDRDELNQGRFVPVDEDSPKAVPQAGAGKIGVAEWAVIVDHETATELPDGQIGEIWISGQNMGTGYWGKPEQTRETFQNILKSRTTPSHAEGAPDDATWVRTGDLGAYYDGELYITGRVKDLVIIDGRNHYPQDLEYSAQEATKALRTGFVAAFSVPANQLPDEVFEDAHSGLKRDPEDTSEQLVIVGERAPGAHKLDVGPIIDDIRAAIAVRHGVTVRDVLLTPAGAIPRTSSGKIGRRACRAAYLDGTLRAGKIANAFPDETD
ncbi:long-chain-fatty-acid--CoA ligase [Mycolicibacterium phlei]|jgi:fatty acid CoA ligase FadD32|uniref:Acyl-AMP synthetase n=1 Tax=Mycolicibacterium phlei DSM 43239 = CCUG 21000 TaxID=1226750 RepID=A0A5N5V5T2_MYCPH|nr:long-chain-fatty-acid--AMP ligase FadD32 [Mycolicibacterium phlei]VEG07184.1 long-chain-fatty-acid--CoA ligase [Mycobacteroides chelonae]AMO59052.1 Long-chain-fatty-acid--AMP ligase FadD32 [Mycolicibacterium phlei]EID12003.1 long-chain-fatty-acid--CoA ligase [Mycolicibacterium phlei RIVM601174]KAB7757225.1 nitrate ABC transporter substrate-binding protein [Mycolicibacterium phlei DSM 43239 = CCUG 21000]KXW65068.1 nitrate ABC transporter substrate-binding protein [Mycolicibacterium phlei DSM